MNFLLLCRVWNALFAGGVCVYSFFIAGGDIPHHLDLLLLSFGVFFLVAFANTHNDIIDFEIDKINRPHRPLPSEKISLRTAGIAMFVWLICAMLCGFASGVEFSILFLIVGILSYAYNCFFKKLPLAGNFAVALLTTTPIIIAIIKLDWPQPVLLNLVFFAFILTLAREIIKDIDDIAGDKAHGLKTFSVLFGANKSLVIAFICELLCLAQLTMLKPLLLAGVAPFIVLSVAFALKKKWWLSQTMIKIAMIAGLVVFAFF